MIEQIKMKPNNNLNFKGGMISDVSSSVRDSYNNAVGKVEEIKASEMAKMGNPMPTQGAGNKLNTYA